MALLPQNKRDQMFAGMGFVALALGVVYYMYVWDPAKTDLDVSQARLDSLLVINQRAKSEMAQGRTAQIKAEAEAYGADLDVMRRLVPTSNEVPALLDQVSTAARRVNLDLSDVQPLPPLTGDQYDAYKYRMSVRGGYHQIGELLSSIGSLQRIIAPINVTLAPQSGLDSRAALKMGKVQPLEARFEIETYVSRTAPSGPAKAGDKAAGKPVGETKKGD